MKLSTIVLAVTLGAASAFMGSPVARLPAAKSALTAPSVVRTAPKKALSMYTMDYVRPFTYDSDSYVSDRVYGPWSGG